MLVTPDILKVRTCIMSGDHGLHVGEKNRLENVFQLCIGKQNNIKFFKKLFALTKKKKKKKIPTVLGMETLTAMSVYCYLQILCLRKEKH